MKDTAWHAVYRWRTDGLCLNLIVWMLTLNAEETSWQAVSMSVMITFNTWQRTNSWRWCLTLMWNGTTRSQPLHQKEPRDFSFWKDSNLFLNALLWLGTQDSQKNCHNRSKMFSAMLRSAWMRFFGLTLKTNKRTVIIAQRCSVPCFAVPAAS